MCERWNFKYYMVSWCPLFREISVWKIAVRQDLSVVWNQEVDEVTLASVTFTCSVSTFSLASTRLMEFQWLRQ